MHTNQADWLRHIRYAALIALLTWAGTAAAQPIPPSVGGRLEQFHRPNQKRPPLPEFPARGPAPSFVLPPFPSHPTEGRTLSAGPELFVRAFELIGNTVLAPDAVREAMAPYLGRVISSAELETLRHRLTLLYVNGGFINSGVVIPDQQVEDGVIILQAVEGKLCEVTISGPDWLRPEYVANRVRLSAGPPLNVEDLRERLQLLQLDPLIRSLNAELSPGVLPGEGTLRVAVQESRPYKIELTMDNHRAPSVGAIQAAVHAAHWNVSGWGDTAELSYAKTEGLDDLQLRYSIPLSARDTRLAFEFSRSDSEVVEEPFNRIDIESSSRRLTASLSHLPLREINRLGTVYQTVSDRKAATLSST